MKLYANNANTGIWVKLGESYSNSGFTGIYAEVSIEIDSKSATLFNLPAYVDGVAQTYSWLEEIDEITSNYYTITAYDVSGTTTTITNTYDEQRMCLAVVKVWDDNNDQDRLRPSSITVTLEATNVTNFTPIDFVLTEDDGWMAL